MAVWQWLHIKCCCFCLIARAASTAVVWKNLGRSCPRGSKAHNQFAAPTLDACKEHCQRVCFCKAIRYVDASKRCHLYTRKLGFYKHPPGVHCFAVKERVPDVFVMLPLDTLNLEGKLTDPESLTRQLRLLHDLGVDGFMVDFWWGITEPYPGRYNFKPYVTLIELAKEFQLKVQVVTSFHQCGGNVGDNCDIALPAFVREANDIWYKDAQGVETREYISLFADDVAVKGRTPIQMYGEWFAAFAMAFASDLGKTIINVMVGMGPSGELRYPAYPLNRWHFCGIGEFQCYDKHALGNLKSRAKAAGNEAWGIPLPPSMVGHYNRTPLSTKFFTRGFRSSRGKFFLEWYSSSLKAHASRVLSKARDSFEGKVPFSGKVAGVHWWSHTVSRAAELTAGYYNTNLRNAYLEIAHTFKSAGASALDFTCLEMRNLDPPKRCKSAPASLVQQVVRAVHTAGLQLIGENALTRYDDNAYNTILSYKSKLAAFTYLSLTPELVSAKWLSNFTRFVKMMHSNGRKPLQIEGTMLV